MTYLVSEMSNKKIALDDLEDIGWMFDLKLHLPPFAGNVDECFFDIDDFKNKDEFNIFIKMINHTGIAYEYAKKNNKIFLIINTGDIT